jgi:hypothetical protein
MKLTKKQIYQLYEEVEKAILGAKPILPDDAIDTRMTIEYEVGQIFSKFLKSL